MQAATTQPASITQQTIEDSKIEDTAAADEQPVVNPVGPVSREGKGSQPAAKAQALELASSQIAAKPDARKPLTPVGSSTGKNPINASLLEPMDSTTAELVKAEIEPDDQPEEVKPQQPASAPLTPAQVRQRRLETAPAGLSPEEKRRIRSSKTRATPRSSRRQSFDRGTARRSVDEEAYRSGRPTNNALLASNGSGSTKMHGQDTLEVRSVTLENGQKASLILEEGRLQRIVAANGQVAELRWNPPPLNRIAGPQRQLAVKLHRGISPPRSSDASKSSQGMPASIRRWANSLSSQRLTTGPAAIARKQALLSAPSGYDALNSEQMRSIKSLDLQSGGENNRKRSIVNSLFSLPTSGVKSNSQGDMPTILETNREVHKDWNPIHESWLPSTMTTQHLGVGAASGEERAGGEVRGRDANPLLSGAKVGRSLEDRKKMTQSVDAALGSRPVPVFEPQKEEPRPASIAGGENFRVNASLYDSDPGPAFGARKRLGFWKVLKRILHLPSISKPRSPKVAKLNKQKRPSFAQRASKHFGSFGSANRRTSLQQTIPPEQTGRHRLQSMSALPDPSVEFSDGSVGSSRAGSKFNKSRSTQSVNRASKRSKDKNRSTAADVFLPLTPQQVAQERREASETPSTPDNSAGPTGIVEAGQPGDKLQAERHVQSRVGAGSELIDTAELRAALAQRKSARDALLSQASNPGDDRAGSRSRRRRDEKSFSGKQRTMMAGKWQKNFTEGTSGAKVDELLQVSSLQRLARERIVEMEIIETEETFEMIWHIPLNGSASKISKTDRYLKNGEVVEAARRDGRPGVLRSQLTFTPEGHVHIRALQGEPFSAVFHDRIKLSTGGRRIKIEQKFQLLQPGVLPVKYHSIWNRVE